MIPNISFAESDFILGVSGSINDPNLVVLAAKGAGIKSIRVDAPWAQIEKVKGEYEIPVWLETLLSAMEKNDIEPLLILDYGNPLYGITKPKNIEEAKAFAKYAAWVVSHLSKRVEIFQLWNEWETKVGGGEPGTVEDYIEFAKIVVPAIRRANPDAILLSTGISFPGITEGWIDTFFRLGGLSYFDGIALHPYVWHLKKAWTPESSIKLIDKIYQKAFIQADGKAVAIYITEMGYPNHIGRFGTNTEVASWYLERFMLLASSRNWLKGVWWYGLRDQGNNVENKEHNFGLFTTDMRPKPSVSTIRRLSLVLNNHQRGEVICIDNRYKYKSSSGDLEIDWLEDDMQLERLGLRSIDSLKYGSYVERPEMNKIIP